MLASVLSLVLFALPPAGASASDALFSMSWVEGIPGPVMQAPLAEPPTPAPPSRRLPPRQRACLELEGEGEADPFDHGGTFQREVVAGPSRGPGQRSTPGPFVSTCSGSLIYALCTLRC